MLLAGAGLLIKTLQRIRDVDLGFRPDHMLAMRLPIPKSAGRRYRACSSYFREVLARDRRIAAGPVCGTRRTFAGRWHRRRFADQRARTGGFQIAGQPRTNPRHA